MAAEYLPKLTDLKNLQDLAKIFSLPMLAVAYILQTGLVIGWEGNVWLSVNTQSAEMYLWISMGIIVLIKTIWASFFGLLINAAAMILHTQWNDMVYPVTAIVLFTFGLLGLFPPSDQALEIGAVNSFWFYACFVWGFFCISMQSQLAEDDRKINERIAAAQSERVQLD